MSILLAIKAGALALVNGVVRFGKAVVKNPYTSAIIALILSVAILGGLSFYLYRQWERAEQQYEELQEEVDEIIQEAMDKDIPEPDDPFIDVPDFDFDFEEPTITPTVHHYEEVVKTYESEIRKKDMEDAVVEFGAPDTDDHRASLVQPFESELRASLERRIADFQTD